MSYQGRAIAYSRTKNSIFFDNEDHITRDDPPSRISRWTEFIADTAEATLKALREQSGFKSEGLKELDEFMAEVYIAQSAIEDDERQKSDVKQRALRLKQQYERLEEIKNRIVADSATAE